jgi:hypothetical protein
MGPGTGGEGPGGGVGGTSGGGLTSSEHNRYTLVIVKF